MNWNATFFDCNPVTIGARTLIGPNCSFYGGFHHIDPFVRDGDKGPFFEKPITIGDDCWLGGNVVVLAGVTIGRGSTVGAGSVVTKVCTHSLRSHLEITAAVRNALTWTRKDVPPFHVVTGNPARILRKIDITRSHGSDVSLDHSK